MKHGTIRGIFVLLLTVGFLRADEAKSTSPKDALRQQDAAAKDGKREQDLQLYQASNDREKKFADAIADGDLALAKLEKAVSDKFGKELATKVVHAAGSMNVEDIDAAKEKVDGDSATIEWTTIKAPAIHLVKTEGQWKIPVSELLGKADEQHVDELVKKFKDLAEQLNDIAERVEKDKYRSGEGVRDKVQEVHDQYFPTVDAK